MIFICLIVKIYYIIKSLKYHFNIFKLVLALVFIEIVLVFMFPASSNSKSYELGRSTTLNKKTQAINLSNFIQHLKPFHHCNNHSSCILCVVFSFHDIEDIQRKLLFLMYKMKLFSCYVFVLMYVL